MAPRLRTIELETRVANQLVPTTYLARDQQSRGRTSWALRTAGRPVAGCALGVHRAASRNAIAFFRLLSESVGTQLCDRTGRHRCQEGRIDHLHEVLGEVRVARIELELQRAP